jgi:hypothetical protein
MSGRKNKNLKLLQCENKEMEKNLHEIPSIVTLHKLPSQINSQKK